jgi:hypothetical protein
VAVCVALLGLLAFIPWLGELSIAILMIVILLAGFVIALLMIGTIAGFNLMFPAIACEGADCFEAVERSFTYVFRRPWHMVFYSAVALIYGAICYVFVRFFAFVLLFSARHALPLAVRFIYWLSSAVCRLFGVEYEPAGAAVERLLTVWPEPTFMNLLGVSEQAANWSQATAAFVIQICLLFVAGLVMAFVLSFYFSANTIIYSLMRNKVDSIAAEDVYTELEETEPPKANSNSEEPHSHSEHNTRADPSD